jgi:hypothetical protein
MPANLDFLGIVQCPNGPFIICYHCQCIVGARGTLSTHLQKTHHLPPQQAAPLLAMRLDLTKLAPKTVGQLPLPWPHGIAPVRGLPVFPGYTCPHCSLCTVNKDTMRDHRHKEHQDYSKALYETVQLQTWFSNHRGPGACWWQVDASGPAAPIWPGLLVDNCDPGICKRAEQFIQAPGQACQPEPTAQADLDPAHKEPLVVPQLGGPQCTPDTALYVRRANWLATFAELQHWRAMRTLTYSPKAVVRGPSTLLLQLGNTVLGQATYEYTAETEGVLDYILQHMPLVWNRCQTTFHTTPAAFHAQLASYTEGIAYKRAFAWMQNKDTFRSYTGTWNRLLCLLFRACLTDEDAEVELVDVWSRLSVDVQQQVESIWLDALELYRAKAGLQEPIQERLVRLSTGLVMQDLPLWTAVNRNVLLHFAGILSLDIQASEHAGAPAFVPVSHSTSHLAALLWVARILVLEYALPSRAYPTNGWPSRESYEPQAVDRLVQIHRKYLVQYQHTVIGELLDLKAFGQKTRSYDMARFMLRWSKDGQAVGIEKLNAQDRPSDLNRSRLGQHPLTMQDFRSWIRTSIERAQQHLQALSAEQFHRSILTCV